MSVSRQGLPPPLQRLRRAFFRRMSSYLAVRFASSSVATDLTLKVGKDILHAFCTESAGSTSDAPDVRSSACAQRALKEEQRKVTRRPEGERFDCAAEGR